MKLHIIKLVNILQRAFCYNAVDKSITKHCYNNNVYVYQYVFCQKAIHCQTIQTTALALSSYTVAMHIMYVHTQILQNMTNFDSLSTIVMVQLGQRKCIMKLITQKQSMNTSFIKYKIIFSFLQLVFQSSYLTKLTNYLFIFTGYILEEHKLHL